MIPHPNLPDTTEPKLKEYIRLLHSALMELEAKVLMIESRIKELKNG
jgi:hypothetical protein